VDITIFIGIKLPGNPRKEHHGHLFVEC